MAPQVCTEVNPRLTIRRARFSGGCWRSGPSCCFSTRGPAHLPGPCTITPTTPSNRPTIPCRLLTILKRNLLPLPPRPPPWPPLTAAALIFADVNRAVNNLQLPNENESKAVDARQEIDLRIGASFTRLQTLLLQNKFDWGEYAPDGRIMIRWVLICTAAVLLL